MSNRHTPLMERDTITRKKRHRRKKKRLMVSFFIIVLIFVGTYFAISFIDNEEGIFADLIKSEAVESVTLSPAALITLLPVQTDNAQNKNKSQIEEISETQTTPDVVPITIHPGIRDDKFTNGEVIVDALSYQSASLNIQIEIVETGDSVAYVAEVYFLSLDNLMPVFANGVFHKGYQTTSQMALDNNAVFAVNSDSATAVNYGIIVRDGIIYRDILAADHLAIFGDGAIKTYAPRNISAQVLLDNDAVHVFNFGPKLLNDGQAKGSFDYSHIRNTHPRTAIGYIEPYHYYFVVVDGRSSYSKGMTLEALSAFMKNLGCVDAYNLDGGGSSTMVFMDELINKPEGGSTERDIDGAILLVEKPSEP